MYSLLTEVISALANECLDRIERIEEAPSRCHSDNKCSCDEKCCRKECDDNDGPYRIKENESEYAIFFTDDFDGYRVEIEYEDHMLTLSAKKVEGNKTTKLTYSMSLPDDIDDNPSKIEAKKIDGNHIKVTIPKHCENKCRKIEIK